MSSDRGRRIGAAAGILFAILTIVGFLIPGTPPKADHLNNEYTQFLLDKRSKILTSDGLIVLGFGFFLFFLAALRSHLQDGGGGDRTLTNATVIGGSIGAALIMIGIAVLNGIAFKAAAAGDDALNRAVFDVSNDLLAVAGLAFAVLFASAGLVALANGSLPRPWALLAIVLAVIQVVGAFPLFVKSGFLANGGAFGFVVGIGSTLWVLGTAALIFRGASGPAAPAGATTVADRPAA
jgi:hypothetical protein